MEQKRNEIFAIYHTATDVKRSLLDHYLDTRELDLEKFLQDHDENIHHFEDIRRARRKSAHITSNDLGLGTLNHVLWYCDDMFWKMSFEDFLNKHKDILSTKANNRVLPSGNIGSDVVDTHDLDCLFSEQTGNAAKGITLWNLNKKLSFTVLSVLQDVCPLLHSVNLLTEKQSRICFICVNNEQHNAVEIEELWETMKCQILAVATFCKQRPKFESQINAIQFDSLPSLDHRRIILDDGLNHQVYGKNKEFSAKARKQLDKIHMEKSLDAVKHLCGGKKVLLELHHGGYESGQYPTAVIKDAEKNLQTNMECLDFRKSLSEAKIFDTSNATKEMTAEQFDDATQRLNYLRLFMLVKDVARDAFIDFLKTRLPHANYGYAFNGMKGRMKTHLTRDERNTLFPSGGTYKGDLTDLDLSLLYIVLRSLNTITPHKKGWGQIPEDNDYSDCANLERLRIAKNEFVSHYHRQSVADVTFMKLWNKYRQCIIKIGGKKYERVIDESLTCSIDSKMEDDLICAIANLKKKHVQSQEENLKIEKRIDKLTGYIMLLLEKEGISPSDIDEQTSTDGSEGIVVKAKLEGEALLSASDINNSKDTLNNKDRKVKSVQNGSILFYLELSASAFQSVKYFFGVVDKFLTDVFRLFPTQEQGENQQIVFSIDFLDMEDVRPILSTYPLYDVDFGKSVTLQCTVTADPACTKVYWEKEVDGTSTIIEVTNSDKQLCGSTITSPSLIINNVDNNDTASYICCAENCFGTGRSTPVLLTVFGDIPTVVVAQLPEKVDFGTLVSLQCTITTEPACTKVYWEKEADGISKAIVVAIDGYKFCGSSVTSPSLLINHVDLTDKASYVCYAENCFGIGKSEPVLLTVCGKPPEIRMHKNKYSVQLGSRVALECYISSVPDLTCVQWTKRVDRETTVLRDNDVRYSRKYKGHSNLLVIKNAEFEDQASYICSAENCFGQSNSIPIELYVLPDDELKRDIHVWKIIRQETIPKLSQLVTEMESANKIIKSARRTRNVTVGLSVLGGIIAAPFTGFASAAATAAFVVGGTACTVFVIESVIEKSVLVNTQKSIYEDDKATVFLREKCSLYIKKGANSEFVKAFEDIKLKAIGQLSQNPLESFINSLVETNNACLMQAIERILVFLKSLKDELEKEKNSSNVFIMVTWDPREIFPSTHTSTSHITPRHQQYNTKFDWLLKKWNDDTVGSRFVLGM